MGGSLGNRDDSVKHYKKSEHKWKKYMKYLKNQNKIIFSIAKNSISHCELNKIKNIRAKAPKNKNKNNEVVRLATAQKTDTIQLGSHNTLVLLHAEKLLSSGTNHFLVWTCRQVSEYLSRFAGKKRHISGHGLGCTVIGYIHYFEKEIKLITQEIRNKGQK